VLTGTLPCALPCAQIIFIEESTLYCLNFILVAQQNLAFTQKKEEWSIGTRYRQVDNPIVKPIFSLILILFCRDLGCSLTNLKVLKVDRCSLDSLDGVFGLSSVIELSAAYNRIEDLTPAIFLEHLKILNLRG
jgi:hypothetical protein